VNSRHRPKQSVVAPSYSYHAVCELAYCLSHSSLPWWVLVHSAKWWWFL